MKNFPTNKEINEMFDEKFGIGTEYMDTNLSIDIKSFIHLLRENDRKVVEEFIEGRVLKSDADSPTPLDREELAYNQAFFELRAFLSSNLK